MGFSGFNGIYVIGFDGIWWDLVDIFDPSALMIHPEDIIMICLGLTQQSSG
jgi:hypothetical protein